MKSVLLQQRHRVKSQPEQKVLARQLRERAGGERYNEIYQRKKVCVNGQKPARILNNIALFRFIKNGNHDECVADAVIVALNMWYAFNVHSIFRKCFTQQFELSARQI